MNPLLFASFDIEQSSGKVIVNFSAHVLKTLYTGRFEHRRNILETSHPTRTDMLLQQVQRAAIDYGPRSIHFSSDHAILAVHPQADLHALKAELRGAISMTFAALHPWVILDDPLDPEGWAICIDANLTKEGVDEVPLSEEDNERLTDVGRSLKTNLQQTEGIHPYVVLPDRVYVSIQAPVWLNVEAVLDQRIGEATGKRTTVLSWKN